MKKTDKTIGLDPKLAKAMSKWDLPSGNDDAEFEAFRARLEAHVNANLPWWRRVWINLSSRYLK